MTTFICNMSGHLLQLAMSKHIVLMIERDFMKAEL
jgi:hypothetical protein